MAEKTLQTFSRLAQEVFRLYLDGKYLKAAEVNEGLVHDFPGEGVLTSYWRICLRNMAGDTAGSLQALETALEEGLWWSESRLRNEADLASLQENPDFERMLAVCRERHQTAQKEVRPELIVRAPSGGKSYPLLIAIHGRDGNAEQTLEFWKPAVAWGWLLAVPQSSQVTAPGEFHWDDPRQGMKEIQGHFHRLTRDYDLNPRHVILAGFSQGGALALQMALRARIPACGFLSVVPGRFASEDLELHLDNARDRSLRGYLVSGGQDPRHDSFVNICRTLSDHGVPCFLEDHPKLGHAYPPDFKKSLKKALAFLLA